MFPKLSIDKISEIQNIINKPNQKGKHRLNMTIKDLQETDYHSNGNKQYRKSNSATKYKYY